MVGGTGMCTNVALEMPDQLVRSEVGSQASGVISNVLIVMFEVIGSITDSQSNEESCYLVRSFHPTVTRSL